MILFHSVVVIWFIAFWFSIVGRNGVNNIDFILKTEVNVSQYSPICSIKVVCFYVFFFSTFWACLKLFLFARSLTHFVRRNWHQKQPKLNKILISLRPSYFARPCHVLPIIFYTQFELMKKIPNHVQSIYYSLTCP